MGQVRMLEPPIKVAEIATKIFGAQVDYQPNQTTVQRNNARSNAYRIVHNARAAGRFPRPSYTLPGQRAEAVWLLATVEKWQLEYFARRPKEPKQFSQVQKLEHLRKCNVAAVKATKIAEAFDADLMASLIKTRQEVSADEIATI